MTNAALLGTFLSQGLHLGLFKLPGDLTPDAAWHQCSMGLLPKSQSSRWEGVCLQPDSLGLCLAHPAESPAHQLSLFADTFRPLQTPFALAKPQASPLSLNTHHTCAHLLSQLLHLTSCCLTWSPAQGTPGPRGAHSSLGVSPEADSGVPLILPRLWASPGLVGPPSWLGYLIT